MFDAVEKNLMHEPSHETRNRKPLRDNPFASHELRVGHLRIFYRTDVIVITSRRKPIAALVSLKALDAEAAGLASNPQFLAILKRSYDEILAGQVVTHDQMKKEFATSSNGRTIRKRSR